MKNRKYRRIEACRKGGAGIRNKNIRMLAYALLVLIVFSKLLQAILNRSKESVKKPEERGVFMEKYGVICLIPVIAVIIVAVVSKRAFESLAVGSIVGFFIIYRTGFLIPWINALMQVISEQAWFMLVFLFSGALIGILNKSGSALGFSDVGVKVCKNRKLALLFTWIIGVCIFIDDYLNNLVIATAAKGITDRYKVSRQYLAYLINATGAAICVLVPISSWAIFMQSMYKNVGVTVNGSEYEGFIASIPYMWYPMLALLAALLTIFGIIPLVGGLKKVQDYVDKTGNVLAMTDDLKSEEVRNQEEDTLLEDELKKSGWWNFLIPLVAIVIITVSTRDFLVGLIIGLVITAVLYLFQKVLSIDEILDAGMAGAADMLPICGLVVAYFTLQIANDEMEMAAYVIGKVEPLMNAAWLPLIAFIVVAVLSFTTASFWGMPAIAFPIIIPLAQSYGCNLFLAAAAVVSGAVFGSNACFYGDAAFLVCKTTNISSWEYGKTATFQMLVPFVLACVVYIAYGLFFS